MSAPAPTSVRGVLLEVIRSRAGLAGAAILIALLIFSVAALLYVGFDVPDKWNNSTYWLDYPRLAQPEWADFLLGKSLPKNQLTELEKIGSSKMGEILVLRLKGEQEFYFDDYPSELHILVNSSSRNAYVELGVRRPDDKLVKLPPLSITSAGEHRINVDLRSDIVEYFKSKYRITPPSYAIYFGIPKGTYVWLANVTSFDGKEVRISVLSYGKTYGFMGTDDKRRDLFLGVAFGIPLAYAFGALAAVAIIMIQTVFGVIAGWFGGRVDALIDRASDIVLIIPFLPTLIILSFFYRLGLFTLLLAVVILSVLGSTTKVVRSMVLQIKEETYIEAARAIGASGARIIFVHILPRVMPYSFSLMVIGVPVYVYLEAALSVVGLGDPILPTLGKIIEGAFSGGAAFSGYWWWILIPSGVLILMTVGFILIGYAFDKILNPRLREA